MSLRPIIWLLVVSSALGCATGRQRLDDVRAVEQARFAAMVRQDIDALGPMLAEELRYCHSNGLCETRAQFLDTIRTGHIRYHAIEVRDLQTRSADGAVIVQGIIDVDGELRGQPARLRLLFTDVYVRRDGRWQLLAWQSTRLPETSAGGGGA